MNKIAINMKNILNISLLSLVVVFLSSCYDDKTNDSFSRLYVSGPTGAAPEATGSYSVGATPGTIAWSIDNTDVASLSTSSGSDVEVSYLKSGDFRITASDGSKEGWLDVTVAATAVGVTVEYTSDGALREDSTGVATFTFDAPLTGAPKFGLDPESTASLVDSLGTLEGSGDEYTVFMRAGAGDGTPDALLRDVAITETYGGETADTVMVHLFAVDNTEPLMTDSESDVDHVQWGDVVTTTFTFNEVMRTKMRDAADTLFEVVVQSSQTIDGVVDPAVNDTIMVETEDWMTFSFEYTIADSTTSGSSPSIVGSAFVLDTLVDLAGNEVLFSLDDPTGQLAEVDMDAPFMISASASKLSTTNANGKIWVNIQASAGDAGVGVETIHYFIKEAYQSDTTDAGVHNPSPKTVAEFTGGFDGELFSGEVSGSTQILMPMDSAAYDVLFITVDEFGYESTPTQTGIDSVRFTYDPTP